MLFTLIKRFAAGGIVLVGVSANAIAQESSFDGVMNQAKLDAARLYEDPIVTTRVSNLLWLSFAFRLNAIGMNRDNVGQINALDGSIVEDAATTHQTLTGVYVTLFGGEAMSGNRDRLNRKQDYWDDEWDGELEDALRVGFNERFRRHHDLIESTLMSEEFPNTVSDDFASSVDAAVLTSLLVYADLKANPHITIEWIKEKIDCYFWPFCL